MSPSEATRAGDVIGIYAARGVIRRPHRRPTGPIGSIGGLKLAALLEAIVTRLFQPHALRPHAVPPATIRKS
jgi:hypothetical protein